MKNERRKNIKIAISGYYGFGSIGDETVLSSIIHTISKIMPKCSITVFNAKGAPKKTTDQCNVSFVRRDSLYSILKTLVLSDILISGGGSLLQDSTSLRSLFYYTFIIKAAKLLRCKVYILSNGLGPLKRKALAAKALRTADRVSLRDPASFDLARSLAPSNAEIYLSADPVFSYPFESRKKTFSACLSKLEGKKFFAISLRNFANERTFNKEAVLQAIRRLSLDGAVPVFVSMQNSFDLEISREFAKQTGGMIADICDADDLFALLERADFAFGMRLHFLLTAFIAKTPILAISYDWKVENCLHYIGIDHILPIENIEADHIVSAIDRAKQSFSKENSRKTTEYLKEKFIAETQAVISLPLSKTSTNTKKKRAKKQVSN